MSVSSGSSAAAAFPSARASPENANPDGGVSVPSPVRRNGPSSVVIATFAGPPCALTSAR